MNTTTDFAALKSRQQAAWASGDYAIIGTTLQIVGEQLAEACDIGLANWTPDSFIGRVFKTLGRHVPPPPGISSPALWGDEAHVRALFGDSASALTATRRTFNFRYRSAPHFVEVLRTWYGPVHKAFAALPPDAAAALEHDLLQLLDEVNVGGASALTVPSDYLEIVAARA